MSNPFTSDIFETTWKAFYCKGQKIFSFDSIGGVKFTKNAAMPLYVNLGRNYTNGMTYTINPSSADLKGKVALIHDVHTRDGINYEGTDRFKLIKISQYSGCYGDLKGYKNPDDIITGCFSSSKSRYNFRRSIKLLEEGNEIRYQVYYGDINKEIYDQEMANFKNLLNRRFDDKNTHNTVLPMWDFYEALIYPMIWNKQVALNVIYNKEMPIAMSINFLDGKALIVAIRTFDIDYNKMNIGNIEVFSLLGWAIKNYIEILDFSKGEAEYKKRWTNNRYEFQHHILYDSKSIIASAVAKSLSYYFSFKQYLRDKNINGLLVRVIHLKKKFLFQN